MKRVRDQALGTTRADFFNAHFRGKEEPVWLASDFMHGSDRQKRVAEFKRDQQEVQFANLQLQTAQATRGKQLSNLPSWAERKW